MPHFRSNTCCVHTSYYMGSNKKRQELLKLLSFLILYLIDKHYGCTHHYSPLTERIGIVELLAGITATYDVLLRCFS